MASSSKTSGSSTPAGQVPHVVIVNWNLPDDTLACVESLLRDGLPAECICVVDNGSTDGSVERLAAGLPPGAVLMRSDENLGFAGGNNLGIEAVLQTGAEWVLLLNNDTFVRPGFFAELAAARALAPDVRLWSPLILYHDNPTIVASAGDKRIAGTLATRGLWQNRVRPVDPPAIVRVELLTATALLVHTEVFRAIGLLDTGYFMYGEDADFSLRAAREGFTLACAMRAELLHKVSHSTGPQSPMARRWRTGSMARVYRRHARGLQLPVMLGFSTLRTVSLTIRDLLAGRGSLAEATWQGWWTGWFGELDKPVGSRPDATAMPPRTSATQF